MSITFYIFEHYQLWMMDSKAQRVFFPKTPKLCVWHTEVRSCYRLKGLGLKQAGPEFLCLGYCRFDDCPVMVTVTVHSEKDFKATVGFQREQSIKKLHRIKKEACSSK